jgi:hypothetical protein
MESELYCSNPTYSTLLTNFSAAAQFCYPSPPPRQIQHNLEHFNLPSLTSLFVCLLYAWLRIFCLDSRRNLFCVSQFSLCDGTSHLFSLVALALAAATLVVALVYTYDVCRITIRSLDMYDRAGIPRIVSQQ